MRARLLLLSVLWHALVLADFDGACRPDPDVSLSRKVRASWRKQCVDESSSHGLRSSRAWYSKIHAKESFEGSFRACQKTSERNTEKYAPPETQQSKSHGGRKSNVKSHDDTIPQEPLRDKSTRVVQHTRHTARQTKSVQRPPTRKQNEAEQHDKPGIRSRRHRIPRRVGSRPALWLLVGGVGVVAAGVGIRWCLLQREEPAEELPGNLPEDLKAARAWALERQRRWDAHCAEEQAHADAAVASLRAMYVEHTDAYRLLLSPDASPRARADSRAVLHGLRPRVPMALYVSQMLLPPVGIAAAEVRARDRSGLCKLLKPHPRVIHLLIPPGSGEAAAAADTMTERLTVLNGNAWLQCLAATPDILDHLHDADAASFAASLAEVCGHMAQAPWWDAQPLMAKLLTRVRDHAPSAYMRLHDINEHLMYALCMAVQDAPALKDFYGVRIERPDRVCRWHFPGSDAQHGCGMRVRCDGVLMSLDVPLYSARFQRQETRLADMLDRLLAAPRAVDEEKLGKMSVEAGEVREDPILYDEDAIKPEWRSTTPAEDADCGWYLA